MQQGSGVILVNCPIFYSMAQLPSSPSFIININPSTLYTVSSTIIIRAV